MTDRIKDLLHEAAEGMEPGDRLDAIRSQTSGGVVRAGAGGRPEVWAWSRRRWWRRWH